MPNSFNSIWLKFVIRVLSQRRRRGFFRVFAFITNCSSFWKQGIYSFKTGALILARLFYLRHIFFSDFRLFSSLCVLLFLFHYSKHVLLFFFVFIQLKWITRINSKTTELKLVHTLISLRLFAFLGRYIFPHILQSFFFLIKMRRILLMDARASDRKSEFNEIMFIFQCV